MNLRTLASTTALLCVSPLACSNDASLGDDHQDITAADDDMASGGAGSADDDTPAASDDDGATTADDDVANAGPESNPSSSSEPAPGDDDTAVVPPPDPMGDDDAPATEPSVTPGVPTSPVDTDAGTAIVPEPEVPAPSLDAGTVGGPMTCDASSSCEPQPPSGLVTSELLASRYNPDLGCFELEREVAGTTEYDPNDPPLCTAAFSLGLSPTGECWSFDSGCQPDGFVPVNPAQPNGVDHECNGAPMCALDWACDPGVLPPELDRSCETDDDCYEQIWTGTCGCSSKAFGFNQRDVAALGEQRRTCVDPSLGSCDCAEPQTLTDSGEVVQDLSQVLTECIAGQCTTRRNPSYCADTAQCVANYGDCVPTDAMACRGATGDCQPCP
jgi:hypothetical protein